MSESATASQPVSSKSNRVTILVFKDNFVSRTFQVPLAWISQVGMGLAAVGILSAIFLAFGIKYYRIAIKTDPSRVQALEEELGDLRASYELLQNKALSPSQVIANPNAPESAAGDSVVTPQLTRPSLFGALPSTQSTTLPPISSLPFRLEQIRTSWRGKSLEVNFNLIYHREDGGSQQGRILILARGPETLLAYPEGSLNRAGHDVLLKPKNGEYFSVSRFRQVRAEFSQFLRKEALQDVEILIFNANGELLIAEQLPTQAPPSSASTPLVTPSVLSPVKALPSAPPTIPMNSEPTEVPQP